MLTRHYLVVARNITLEEVSCKVNEYSVSKSTLYISVVLLALKARGQKMLNVPRTSVKMSLCKRSVTIRREICPIRAEISTHKHGEKLYISYLYD